MIEIWLLFVQLAQFVVFIILVVVQSKSKQISVTASEHKEMKSKEKAFEKVFMTTGKSTKQTKRDRINRTESCAALDWTLIKLSQAVMPASTLLFCGVYFAVALNHD